MKCSICGTEAYYDGRMGDGPILTCGCSQVSWVDDGRGGYWYNPYNAHPIENDERAAYERPYPEDTRIGGGVPKKAE